MVAGNNGTNPLKKGLILKNLCLIPRAFGSGYFTLLNNSLLRSEFRVEFYPRFFEKEQIKKVMFQFHGPGGSHLFRYLCCFLKQRGFRRDDFFRENDLL